MIQMMLIRQHGLISEVKLVNTSPERLNLRKQTKKIRERFKMK